MLYEMENEQERWWCEVESSWMSLAVVVPNFPALEKRAPEVRVKTAHSATHHHGLVIEIHP